MNQIESGSFYTKVKNQISSSVDPPCEKIQPLQSAHGKGDASSAHRSPETKKKSKNEETDTKKDAPPERYFAS